jgi:hypothetical protein
MTTVVLASPAMAIFSTRRSWYLSAFEPYAGDSLAG